MRISTLLLVLAVTTGCGNIAISYSMPPKVPTRPAGLGDGMPTLALDEMGNLLLGSDPLQVESHMEPLRFGLTAVDVGHLPRAWRPRHLSDFDGPIVTSLCAQSPIALAGLRPFDGIESIDGTVLDSAKALTEQLAAKRPGETITLGVTAPDGRREITAEAANGVSDTSSVSLPFVYVSRKSALESSVEIGPLSLSRYHEQINFDEQSEAGPWPAYVRSVVWRTVLNLVNYHGTSTLDGRPLSSQWRILWFITIDSNSDERSSS